MAPTDSSPVVAQPPNSLDHHVVALRLAHEALVRKYLRKGDTLTHTRCMGCLEEHVFVEYAQANGRTWLRGTPTKDTIRLGGSREPADDIAFYNIKKRAELEQNDMVDEAWNNSQGHGD